MFIRYLLNPLLYEINACVVKITFLVNFFSNLYLFKMIRNIFVRVDQCLFKNT